MYEAIPVSLGVVLALFLARSSITSARTRAVAIGAASLVVGFAVAAATGELGESWLFGLFDAAQMALAAVLTGELVKRYAGARLR